MYVSFAPTGRQLSWGQLLMYWSWPLSQGAVNVMWIACAVQRCYLPPPCCSLLDSVVDLDGDVLLKKTFVSGEEVTGFISEVNRRGRDNGRGGRWEEGTMGGGTVGGGGQWEEGQWEGGTMGRKSMGGGTWEGESMFTCQADTTHGSMVAIWGYKFQTHSHVDAQTLYAGEGQGHPCSSLSTGWGFHSSDAGLNWHWGAPDLPSHTVVACLCCCMMRELIPWFCIVLVLIHNTF